MITKQHEALDAAIPVEAIHTKPGKGGLSYVAGGWVKDRMNAIFGPDGWSDTCEWQVAPGDKPVVFAKVRIIIHEPGNPANVTCWREDCAAGTGHGNDAWHQAIGEACTDAFKRAAAKLGRHLGLQLYLKDEDPRSKPARPMSLDMSGRIVEALNGANGDARRVVAAARARLSEYQASAEQRSQIEAAIAKAEARVA